MNTESTSTIYCEQCGAKNRPSAKYCRSCGQKIEPLAGADRVNSSEVSIKVFVRLPQFGEEYYQHQSRILLKDQFGNTKEAITEKHDDRDVPYALFPQVEKGEYTITCEQNTKGDDYSFQWKDIKVSGYEGADVELNSKNATNVPEDYNADDKAPNTKNKASSNHGDVKDKYINHATFLGVSLAILGIFRILMLLLYASESILAIFGSVVMVAALFYVSYGVFRKKYISAVQFFWLVSFFAIITLYSTCRDIFYFSGLIGPSYRHMIDVAVYSSNLPYMFHIFLSVSFSFLIWAIFFSLFIFVIYRAMWAIKEIHGIPVGSVIEKTSFILKLNIPKLILLWLFVIVIWFALFSVTDQQLRREGNRIRSNGLAIMKDKEYLIPFDGFYKNGKIVAKRYYLPNGSHETHGNIPDGIYVDLDAFGNKVGEWTFKNQKATGKAQLFKSGLMQSGYAIEGKFEGESIFLDKQGRIRMRGNFTKGDAHGVFEIYDQDGNVKEKVSYINGVPSNSND